MTLRKSNANWIGKFGQQCLSIPTDAIVTVTLTQLSTCIRNDAAGSNLSESLQFSRAIEQNSKPPPAHRSALLIALRRAAACPGPRFASHPWAEDPAWAAARAGPVVGSPSGHAARGRSVARGIGRSTLPPAGGGGRRRRWPCRGGGKANPSGRVHDRGRECHDRYQLLRVVLSLGLRAAGLRTH